MHPKRKMKLISIGFSVIVILMMFSSVIFQKMTEESGVIFTVTHIERIIQDEQSKYLVFTEGENGKIEVFENTDTVLYFKFNSSDIQARLRPGKKIEAKVNGLRIPFLSMYRNIIAVKELQ